MPTRWLHAPPHNLTPRGTYIITAGTLHGATLFHTPEKRDILAATTLDLAADYPWCSARWFETNARESFVKSVYSFKIDRVKVMDDF